MSEATPTAATTIRPALVESVRTDPAWRWLLLAAGAIAGYHYSLAMLWEQLGGQTPTAYLALVPLLAAALAWLRPITTMRAPGHDGEFNLLLGLGLLVPVLIVLVVLPVQMGAAYWAYRIDMLSLPLYLAGAVTLLFGYDTLRAYRVPILFTVLAWPYPYYLLLAQPVQALTATTSAATALVTSRLGVADLTAQSGVFSVLTPSGPTQLAVGEACAGLMGIVGILLVGGAVALLVRGTVAARAAWLAWGVGLSFAANVVRIVLLMVVGNRFGMDLALNLLHPILGMALDAAVLLLLLMLLPVFGLRLPPAEASRRRPLPVPRLGLTALAALVLVTGVVALADDDLSGLSPLTDASGQARLAAFGPDASMPPGWRVEHVKRFDWGRQYFGQDSTFDRYLLAGPDDQVVWADVVTTSTGSLAQYPVEGCLAFHGDTITMRHPPPTHLHGSNLVVDEEVENQVGWDIGTLDGQAFVAEDLVFGLRCYSVLGRDGFGWHGATMLEQPPLSLYWAFRQRQRWVLGALQGIRALWVPGELAGITRRDRLRISGSILYRVGTYALGFPLGLAGLLTLAHGLLGLVVSGMAVTPNLWTWPLLAAAGCWLLSYQIGLARNLRDQRPSAAVRIVNHLVVLLLTPVAGLAETAGPFTAVVKWMLGLRQVSWTPTLKATSEGGPVRAADASREERAAPAWRLVALGLLPVAGVAAVWWGRPALPAVEHVLPQPVTRSSPSGAPPTPGAQRPTGPGLPAPVPPTAGRAQVGTPAPSPAAPTSTPAPVPGTPVPGPATSTPSPRATTPPPPTPTPTSAPSPSATSPSPTPASPTTSRTASPTP